MLLRAPRRNEISSEFCVLLTIGGPNLWDEINP